MTNPTTPERLEELARRCETATGPDRELDEAIASAFGWKPWPRYGDDRWQNPANLMVEVLRPYTASLDTALTLVPEGWHLQLADWSEPVLTKFGPWQAILSPPGIRTGLDGLGTRCEHAATPSLALCAAALRTRASALRWPGDE